MIGVVDERLDRARRRSAGYILDGFPRTVAQAEALEPHHRATGPLDVVINLEVPEDVVIERIASRRVCARPAATIYSVDDPPTHDVDCDICGGDVVQRDDDTEEAVRAPARRSTSGRPRPLLAVLRGAGPAGRGRRHRHRRRGRRRGWSTVVDGRPAVDALDRADRSSRAVRTLAEQLAAMRRAGRVVAEMHDRIRAAIRPGVTTARARPHRPGGARPPGRDVELPRLPRLPGGDLRLAQRGDRPRHPRGRRRARGGRHRLDRLRRDRRRLARRRRLHRPGGRGRRRGRAR